MGSRFSVGSFAQIGFRVIGIRTFPVLPSPTKPDSDCQRFELIKDQTTYSHRSLQTVNYRRNRFP